MTSCGQPIFDLRRGREARGASESIACVDDLDLVADLGGERGQRGREVDRPEDHHPRWRRVGADVHAQVVTERGAVLTETADRGLALLEQSGRLPCDVAIQEVAVAQGPDHGAVDDREPRTGGVTVQQGGDPRGTPLAVTLEHTELGYRVGAAQRLDEDVHDPAAHQPHRSGQLVGDAVGEHAGPALAGHDRLGLHDNRPFDAAAGDRPLDRAVLVDQHHRPGGQRRRALDLDQQRLHETPPLDQPPPRRSAR